ncbi:hypothetical protein AAHA92_34017 [Salvia divinorum]|uniref:Uncharacterized protein n=1 Tax=Salvia divinorum TaxID=28513 RepID=A0ABD1FHK4_SALDI
MEVVNRSLVTPHTKPVASFIPLSPNSHLSHSIQFGQATDRRRAASQLRSSASVTSLAGSDSIGIGLPSEAAAFRGRAECVCILYVRFLATWRRLFAQRIDRKSKCLLSSWYRECKTW